MSQTMIALSSVVLLAAATVSFRHWRKDGGSGPAMWSLVTFSILAAALTEIAVTDVLGVEPNAWWTKVLLAVLVFFPFSLFRFARSFENTFDMGDRAALTVTSALSLGALVLDLGDRGSETWLDVYLFALLGQWTVLSIAAAVRLWRAGAGLPAIGRSRMRLTGGAAVGLNVAILLTLLPRAGGPDGAVEALVLVTSLLFLLGVSPPAFLRQYWRQADRMTFEETVQGLMAAATSEEIGEVLLRDAMALVGAESAELVDGRGATLARARGTASGAGSEPQQPRAVETIELGGEGLQLLVRLSPYAPYFGAEEAALLRTVGALARLSLERSVLFEQRAGTVRDLQAEIEERRRAESELANARDEAQRANLAKNDFLSRMSHELRTPLNSILGYAQLLGRDELDPDQGESVKQIERAGRHLLDLINEVLDLSRIEAGRLSISLEPVAVNDLLEECVALMRPLANARSISLSLDSDESGWEAHVRADHQRLKQVVLNLLSNAVKYNRLDGSVSVVCRVDGVVEIAVRDTGLGIPGHKLDRLFVAFDRLDMLDEQEEGTGLGLSVSRNLVVLMGGELEVQSQVDVGSTFTIRLPLVDATVPVASTVQEEDKQAAGTSDASCVLYIEDNASNVRLLERVLRLRPLVSLTAASNGEEGIAMAGSLRPDLILLDVNLPDLNGDDVLTRLRGDPRTKDIPVVFVSADATERQIKKLLDAGAAAYVTKPLEIDHFLSTVDRVLGDGHAA